MSAQPEMTVIEGDGIPEIKIPNANEKYWTYYLNPKTQFDQVIESVWTGGFVDQIRLKEGRIYTTKQIADTACDLASK